MLLSKTTASRVALAALTCLLMLAGCSTSPSRPAAAETHRPDQVKALVSADLVRLITLVDRELLPLAIRPTSSIDSLRTAFVRCRLAYKQVEAFSEYFLPSSSRLVNGAPVPEIEVEETRQFEPGGLQVIETLLYPAPDAAGRRELREAVSQLRRQLRSLTDTWAVQEFTDSHVFDALRQETFRIVALGISGFDTPAVGTALPEATAALVAMQGPLHLYAPTTAAHRPAHEQLRQQLDAAVAYLRQPVDFARFDRYEFITRHANPLGRALLAYQRQIGVAPFTELRSFRGDAATLFDSAAFNPDFYTGNTQWFTNSAKVALGRKLFFDPNLSGTGTRSCASCHQPSRAFTDGLAVNATLSGSAARRNTPTLYNAALQAGQFYDLRASTLENQSLDVIGNRNEMHGSLPAAAVRFRKEPAYVAMFRQAFPQAEKEMEAVHIQNALAAYERSLVRLNSRFDQAMRGNPAALSPSEIAGFNLFIGKGRCATCHFLPLLNGTVPPSFTDSEAEVLGVPTTPAARRLDSDPGRYAHTKLPSLQNAFKTPTLRNVALTAPYMHNGAYQTLEQVVDFYNEGGGVGLGLSVPTQTLPADKLHLTPIEKRNLIAFMQALNDTTGLHLEQPRQLSQQHFARK
ncbi:cytochrome c peroxidase [Hymenobacter arizonensis]|uniref:Cytochrome c peroxidase n=1 Tax=Hymenobacter arizonensis TaxID=1227077 RepID=A0A1I5UKI9_HYMAR|nr:cytochrome c peroxidase [Hymenobacter arizonensis]SFP95774.1 cytochrome c peroxidase [Hymenobacter arizonensis]